jgi:hypothetical protein
VRVLISVGVLLALLVPAIAACSDRETAPSLGGPASRYVPATEELPTFLEVFPPETYNVTRDLFTYLGPFTNRNEADEFARAQGYQSGYRAQFSPNGLLAGVVSQGQYYLTVETYLFSTPEGARAVYDRYHNHYRQVPGSEEQDTGRLGNRSSGWEYIEGTIGETETVAVYHRFVYQRGNMIGVVQTYGADEHMSIDVARSVATLIDRRATGQVPAVEPTPPTPLASGAGQQP